MGEVGNIAIIPSTYYVMCLQTIINQKRLNLSLYGINLWFYIMVDGTLVSYPLSIATPTTSSEFYRVVLKYWHQIFSFRHFFFTNKKWFFSYDLGITYTVPPMIKLLLGRHKKQQFNFPSTYAIIILKWGKPSLERLFNGSDNLGGKTQRAKNKRRLQSPTYISD